MFVTFGTMPSSGTPTPPDPAPQSQPSSWSPPRPWQKKRSQVARACDWCRLHRIKCDSEHPCSNCKRRGVQCSNSGTLKSATLPHAYREIERLQQRVQELELEKQRKNERPVPQLLPSSSHSSDSHNSGLDLEKSRSKSFGEGIHVSTARSPQKTWYGSSSLFYFIGRIDTFLTCAFQQAHSADRMLPESASTLLDGPTANSSEDQVGQLMISNEDSINDGNYLTATQEEYFLDLFWQSYYTLCPILDEREFKEYHRSLWSVSNEGRKPSALVDIVIAVCMQYGIARLLVDGRGFSAVSKANLSITDAQIAGRWHYRRCQTLLLNELESPTISTLQCHVLCSIYLCCGSFQNMADNACGLAARTAYMLGLHLEPPQSLSRREKELRKRLWWTLYVIETKTSMKLGRPFQLHDSSTSCSLPADDREIAMLSSSSFASPGENVTWLTWNLHNIKLILAARFAYTTFYDVAPNTFNRPNSQPITEWLEDWLKDVPEALKTRRQNGGTPFSTDRSLLDIEQFAPLWLQLQRLLLELLYHNLCANLLRPSISFALATTHTSPADGTAERCAAHAVALTNIMHQVLTSTSILAGWHEAFQWQWNGAITLVGFVLAHPHGTSALAVRSAIDLAVTVFEIFGNSFAVAANAANILRELCAKIDILMQKSQGKEGVALDKMQLVKDHPEVDEGRLVHGQFSAALTVNETLNFADVTNVAQDIFATDMYGDFDLSGIDVLFPDG